MHAAIDRRPATRRGLGVAAAVVASVGLGWLLPALGAPALLLSLLAQAAILALLATSVGCLMRMSGLVSFGHASFYGLAMYVVALSLQHLQAAPEAAVLAALALPSLLAFVLALVARRLSGMAFSMMMLAVGQALHEVAAKARGWTGGDEGITLALPASLFGLQGAQLQRPETALPLCWTVLAAVLWSLYGLSRSRFGLRVRAVRDNEERARFIGLATVLPRAAMMALTGFIAALAGVLAVFYQGFVSPDALHWSQSGAALVMAVVGGVPSVWGPAFGAIAFQLLKDVAGGWTEHWRGVLGASLILFILWAPGGLAGLLRWVWTKAGGRR